MLRFPPSGRYRPPVSPGISDAAAAALFLQPKAKDAATQAVEKRLTIERQAIAANLLHRGRTETLDIIDRVENPLVRVSIVSYTVLPNNVLKLTHIGVWFSEPLVSMSRSVGWNIYIDGSRVPRVHNAEDEQRYDTVADISQPMALAPLWIQAGETVSIDAIPLFGFACALTIVAKLSGRLYEPTGPHGKED